MGVDGTFNGNIHGSLMGLKHLQRGYYDFNEDLTRMLV